MTLRQALVVLRRGWLVILASVIVSMLAAGYYLYKQPITYSATATVSIPPSSTVGQTAPQDPSILLNVNSNATAAIAARALHLDNATDLASTVTPGFDSVQSIVSITATESDATDATRIANAFAVAYVTSTKDAQAANLRQLNSQLSKTVALAAKAGEKAAADPKNNALATQLTVLENSEQSLAGSVGQASLVRPPTLNRSAAFATPNAQSKSLILGLAFVVGLLIGVGILLIRAPFDTRLRTAGETERLTGYPVLAELPYTPAYRKGSTALAVVDSPRTSFAESVRELRTSTQVLLGETRSAAIVMTSPAPFDGKTLITANMAASWALSGKQTVLVAGDMRRPRIHEFFGLSEPEKGVADLLELPEPTREDVAALLRTTDVPGLMFLSAGKPVGDPADLLASRRMADVTDHLRALADIVVVDAPPVLAAADASIIGSYSDGIIVVIRAAQSKDKAVAETVKRLTAARITVLGVAFNRVKVITGSAYRRYYSEASDEPTFLRRSMQWLGRTRPEEERGDPTTPKRSMRVRRPQTPDASFHTGLGSGEPTTPAIDATSRTASAARVEREATTRPWTASAAAPTSPIAPTAPPTSDATGRPSREQSPQPSPTAGSAGTKDARPLGRHINRSGRTPKAGAEPTPRQSPARRPGRGRRVAPTATDGVTDAAAAPNPRQKPPPNTSGEQATGQGTAGSDQPKKQTGRRPQPPRQTP